MKLAGSLMVVLSAFALGYVKKAKLAQAERSLELLIFLFSELRCAMTCRSASLTDALRQLGEREDLVPLGFLSAAMRDTAAGGSLRVCLGEAFALWAASSSLSTQETDEVRAVLSQLGTQSLEQELERLARGGERLQALLDARRADPRAHRGYYELLYTLGGAVVALLLL